MATSSFYNDNLFRSYPFIAGQDVPTVNSIRKIDNKWIAGLKLYLPAHAPFTSFPTVFLTKITRAENLILSIMIQDNSENEEKYDLTFDMPPAENRFWTLAFQSQNIYAQLTVGEGIQEIENIDIDAPYLRLEPTCLIWLQHRGINKVEVGNQARNTVPLPENIVAENYGMYPWWKQGKISTEITGPLLFSAGFNCAVKETPSKSLQIAAVSGGGEGTVLEDYTKGFVYLADMQRLWEVPPEEYLRKDGLFINDFLIYSFCGASGPHITLSGSESILVIPTQANHTITISVGNLGGGAC